MLNELLKPMRGSDFQRQLKVLCSPHKWRPEFKSDHSAIITLEGSAKISVPIHVNSKTEGYWCFSAYPWGPIPYLNVEPLFGNLLEKNLVNRTGSWGLYREDENEVLLVLHLVWQGIPSPKLFQTICEGMTREVCRVYPLIQELLPST